NLSCGLVEPRSGLDAVNAGGLRQMTIPTVQMTEIGRRMPRAATRRLAAGRGRYVDDISLPRQLHAAFLRSPHPHAKIAGIHTAAAAAVPGVAAVFTAVELGPVCAAFQCISAAAPGLVSPPQHALAAHEAVFQGEPVVMAIAETRAVAEDALELVGIDWQV